MTKKVVSLGIVMVLVLAAGFYMWAAPQRENGMKHAGFGLMMAEKFFLGPEMLLKHKDELGLSQDQVAKIEKMRDAFMESHIKQQADIKIKEMKLRSAIQKDKIDRKEVEKMIRDIAKQRTDMQIDRMNYLLDVKSVLTDEQIKKIEEFRKNRRHEMMREHMGRPGKGMGMGRGMGMGNPQAPCNPPDQK